MDMEEKQEFEARIAQLERQLWEAKSQYTQRISSAFDALDKARDAYIGSGVILSVSAIGGKEVIPPVMIRDGLSDNTIKAIQKDLRHSFEIATMVNPAIATA